jgi:hypothetical protein
MGIDHHETMADDKELLTTLEIAPLRLRKPRRSHSGDVVKGQHLNRNGKMVDVTPSKDTTGS